jgi:mono/diheme cytochrome c family protein
MYTGIMHTHTLVVVLFLLIYLIKTFLLLANKTAALYSFTKKVKVPEMIVSTLFLVTGIYLAMNTGNSGSWLWVKIVVVALSIPIAVIAFKKNSKGLAVLSLLMIVYSYGISETKSPVMKKAKVADKIANISSADIGKEIFTTECVRCHGEDGKAMRSGAYDLSVTQKTPEQLKAMIMDGEKQMPSYKNVLTPEQIDAVLEHVISLKK